eukprot:907113-Pleurochrysis_carterae.AAC.1
MHRRPRMHAHKLSRTNTLNIADSPLSLSFSLPGRTPTRTQTGLAFSSSLSKLCSSSLNYVQTLS